ncbi:histidine kinase dimerization/phospho-acceptor domain-containing protein [Roseateles sp.]|jgi:signal transduction histidine kinase|uniref:histidine kinase dimerization/phospho-acceptor domain-containing protein n=1 Tax=Roseateles sp. TaxID=1971397 RepID=UPI0037C92304
MTTRYRARLQRRLMLAFTGYTLLVSALFALFAMAFVYAVEDQFFETTLDQEAQRQAASRAAGGDWLVPAQPFVRLYRPGQAWPEDLAEARRLEPQAHELAGREGRHYHLRKLKPEGAWLVAEVSGQLVVRPMREQLLTWLGLWGGGLALLALGLGGWLARRTSAPLGRLAQTVAQSQPAQLPTDLPQHYGDDEVGLLAAHLAQLNQRTQDFIAREQAFTRDASHELRTPLAVLGLACEDLQRQATPGQQAALASLSTAIWQLQQTVDLLMALAREEHSPILASPELPLLPRIEQLVLAMAPLLDRQDITLDIDVPATLTRPWPPALTRLLLSNLLANAINHGNGGVVRIEADADQLRLGNASAAPPEALLLEDAAGSQAGLKGEASSGQGLGLSIVRRLAERHGLQLRLSHRAGWTWVGLHARSETDAFTSS